MCNSRKAQVTQEKKNSSNANNNNIVCFLYLE